MQPLGKGALGQEGANPPVVIRYFTPTPALAPYFTTFYISEVNPSDGGRVADWLHPEWANLRFFKGTNPNGAIGPAEPAETPQFAIVGPTSHGTWFESGKMRSWGIGVLPLGWTKFFSGAAEDYADSVVDGNIDANGAIFRPLYDILFGGEPEPIPDELAKINNFLLGLLDKAPEDEPHVLAAHAALADPDVATVADLSDRLGLSSRSVERLSRKAFGFPPKLLLRRQRFLRTLAHVMLDPSQNWVRSLDEHYHDQAHFARDFQRFMGMTAREYMAHPHPFLSAAVHGRLAAAGAAMQVLHRPDAEKG